MNVYEVQTVWECLIIAANTKEKALEIALEIALEQGESQDMGIGRANIIPGLTYDTDVPRLIAPTNL